MVVVVKRGGECGFHSNTSSSCAIARRCCFAMAVSFCCTIRSRLIDSLSCTLILDCDYCGEHSLKENSIDGGESYHDRRRGRHDESMLFHELEG